MRSSSEIDEVDGLQELADGFRAHFGFKGIAVVLARLAVVVFVEQLVLLELRGPFLAGVGDDVVLKIDDLFQAGGLHVQQRTEAAGHRLEEPDVDDGRGQLDVAHALAADAAVRDLDAATVADHALIFHAAVLAAGAFPVFLGAEDPFAEQAVFFRPVGAVVDRLRLLDLAEGPTADVVRAGEADAHRPVIVNTVVIHVTGTHVTALL